MSSPTVVPSSDEWMYETDRLYISRLSPGPLLVVTSDVYGQPAAPDGDVVVSMTPQFTHDPEVTLGGTWTATATSTTEYEVVLPPAATSTPGPFLARWDYTVGGHARAGEQPVMIGGSAPAYDALSPEWKAIVESVWLRVADQFDSPMGGPHLQVYMQAHFGRNRIAQLLPIALGRMNTISQPVQTYSLADPFPFAKWGSLLSHALWVETIKHLRRSYMEQPDPVGVTVARLDRRTYMGLWGQLLAEEEAELRPMLDHFKMQHMNLGGGSVLVAGGIYPRISPYHSEMSGIAAPRGLYLTR